LSFTSPQSQLRFGLPQAAVEFLIVKEPSAFCGGLRLTDEIKYTKCIRIMQYVMYTDGRYIHYVIEI